MTTSTLSPLEQIAAEFNKRDERNPAVLLDFINQYYVVNGKQPLSHLDEITFKHATGALGTIFGFNDGNPVQARQKFAEYGIFSSDLSQYEQGMQDKVIENLIGNISNGRFSTFYLSEDNPCAERNNQIIAHSQKMKEYILSQASHLDEITTDSGIAKMRKLADIFGFRFHNPIQVRQRFAEYGIFSPDLSEQSYDSLREDICQKLIDNLSNSNSNSFYTSPTLEETTLQTNRGVILASNAVQTFFSEQGYDMNDPSTMNDKVRLFFKKYMGAKDIGSVIPLVNVGSGRDNGNLPLYRRIQKEWAEDEEGFLRDIFTDADGSEIVFIEMLARQRPALEDLLGVSYSAVINKCQYMGLLHRNESGGTRETGIPVYAFPDIHRQEFGDYLRGFNNYAFLLAHNIVPAVTLALAYESVPDEREEFQERQFEHVTLPIRYRGADITQYTQAEQAILSAVQHYISDNGRFPRNERGDIMIDPATEHGFDPIILQIRADPNNNLIQLIFRKRFNPTNEIETTAINIGHGREIYLFKHELHPTYQNTRV